MSRLMNHGNHICLCRQYLLTFSTYARTMFSISSTIVSDCPSGNNDMTCQMKLSSNCKENRIKNNKEITHTNSNFSQTRQIYQC